MRRTLFLLFSGINFLLLAGGPSPSQIAQHKTDSMIGRLPDAKDTTRLILLNRIAWRLMNTGAYDKSLRYCEQALHLADSIEPAYKEKGKDIYIQRGMANAYNCIGVVYKEQGQYEKALSAHLKSLKIRLEHPQDPENKKGIGHSYNNLGNIYMFQGKYDKALEYQLKALKIREEVGDKQSIGISFGNIGLVYFYQEEYDKSLEYQLKAMKIQEELNDKQGLAYSFNNIGLIYMHKLDYTKALENTQKALELRTEIGDKQGIGNSYNNLGNIHMNQGYMNKKAGKQSLSGLDYENALQNHFEALKIRQEIGDKKGIADSYDNIGSIYSTIGKINQATEYLNKSLAMYDTIGNKEGLKQAYSALSELYLSQSDYKQAFHYQKLANDMKDSLFNTQSRSLITEMDAKYESEKKDHEIMLLNLTEEHRAAASAAEEKRQRTILIAVCSFLALVMLFTFYVLKGYREKKKSNQELAGKNTVIEAQKKTVEEKNKEITDSIHYALRLQQAILPPLKLIRKHFPESFVFYQPKDIVAGDFYWMESTADTVYLAAADCTGHGVPGALVSVVCSNALNRAIKEFRLQAPGEILDKTRELVVETFTAYAKASGEKENLITDVKDGMDISLAAYKPLSRELQWAGANNPLWIIHQGKLEEIGADKQPIGRTDVPTPFSTHVLQLQKGDLIFLFTDGYADQFGGPRGKKFKEKQLKELLIANATQTLERQQEVLNETINHWRGDLGQVDDILVIGVKI